MDIKSLVRTVPNFPKSGVMFRDITTLLADPMGFSYIIDQLALRYKNQGVTCIAGIESRGFILGAALAYKMGLGFVPLRKKGKLPGEVLRQEYELEYGTDVLEIHRDALKPQDLVVLVDDLMATGGTALGALALIKQCGSQVLECAVVIDLPELGGSERCQEKGLRIHAMMEFEGE